MKTVFTNSEIFHVFNEQKQETGRASNRNIFFEKNKIYSYGYHYLLGEFIDENTILINDKGFSNTTAKHICLLIDATRDKKQFFTEQIETKRAYENLNNWLNKLPRARSYKDIYISKIDSTFKKYIEFIEYTNKKISISDKKTHEKIVTLKNSFYYNLDNLQETIKEHQKIKHK